MQQVRVEIRLFNDAGEVVAEQIGSAINPVQWKAPYEKPLVEGEYSLYGFIYQPQVVLRGKAGGF